MRIVILTQYFLPEIGAPQNRLYELAIGLQQLGWEVSIVTAMPNYPTGKIFGSHKGRMTKTEWIDAVEVKRFWLFASNSKRIFPRIFSMLSFSFSALFSFRFVKNKRPDFILVESPPLTLAFSGWLLSRASSSRLIMNVSDLWPLSAKELGVIRDGFAYRSLERLERFLYRRASMCTGQSQEIVEHILHIKHDRVYLFRNGVDTSRFDQDHFEESKRNCLIYAGLLGIAQGILSIIQEVDFIELGTEFHIYGDGPERIQVERFCNDHPEAGISYRGTVSREKMPALLSAYGGTIIALTGNIYGAVPSKIYESMAAGLPILFSGEGEGARIISDASAGWVNSSGHWDDLKGNILEFVNLAPDDFLALRKRNRQTAQTKFDRSLQIKGFHDYLIEQK